MSESLTGRADDDDDDDGTADEDDVARLAADLTDEEPDGDGLLDEVVVDVDVECTAALDVVLIVVLLVDEADERPSVAPPPLHPAIANAALQHSAPAKIRPTIPWSSPMAAPTCVGVMSWQVGDDCACR